MLLLVQRLYRTLNARQFALKMIANVTYGYTSASYSGRMPCSDIADSIVQYGRETLERVSQRIPPRTFPSTCLGNRIIVHSFGTLFPCCGFGLAGYSHYRVTPQVECQRSVW